MSWSTVSYGANSWSVAADDTEAWNTQSDASDAWAKWVTPGYVELGYVDYIYVEGELISYAVDDVNNTWVDEGYAETTWQL